MHQHASATCLSWANGLLTLDWHTSACTRIQGHKQMAKQMDPARHTAFANSPAASRWLPGRTCA
jgi:hypothetical protein